MLLHIQVRPGSKTDMISIDSAGIIRVKIRAQPIDGKANDYLVNYLAGIFGVSKAMIAIRKGATNSQKTVEINAEEKKIRTTLETFRN